jgi:hypothetical protein
MKRTEDNATDANCEMDQYAEDPHPVFRALGCAFVVWAIGLAVILTVILARRSENEREANTGGLRGSGVVGGLLDERRQRD